MKFKEAQRALRTALSQTGSSRSGQFLVKINPIGTRYIWNLMTDNCIAAVGSNNLVRVRPNTKWFDVLTYNKTWVYDISLVHHRSEFIATRDISYVPFFSNGGFKQYQDALERGSTNVRIDLGPRPEDRHRVLTDTLIKVCSKHNRFEEVLPQLKPNFDKRYITVPVLKE